MSQTYKWEMEIYPVREDEIENVIGRIPYTVDDHMVMGQKHTILCCWGEQPMGGGVATEDRHTELVKLFPNRKVTSRWRCTEYDEWDDMYPEDDDAESNTTG